MSEISPVNPNIVPPYGRRVGAYLIDGAIGGAIGGIGACLSSVVSVVVLGMAFSGGSDGAMGALTVLSILIYLIFGFTYPVMLWHFVATKGWTPGKKILKLAVVDQATGLPIGRGRAALRMVVLASPGILGALIAVIVSLAGGSLVAGILWLLIAGGGSVVWAFVTAQHPRQQGWHDLAAKSVVVPLDPSAGQIVRPGPPIAQPRSSSSPPAPSGPPPPSFNQPPPGPPAPVPAPRPVPAGPPAPPPPPRPPAPPAPAPPHVVPPSVPQSVPPSVPPLIPPPPGLIPPPPGVPAPPAPTPPVAAPAPGRFEATVAGARHSASWTLTAPDGSSHAIEGPVVVGRNPEPTGDLAAAAGWRVEDPELSMSKSHAAFGLDAGKPWVQDLGSTNGVVIQRDGSELPVSVGAKVPLQGRDVVLLGDVPLRVNDR